MLACEHTRLNVVCNPDCDGRIASCKFGRDICCCFCEHKEVCNDACADAKAAGWDLHIPRAAVSMQDCRC